MVEIVISRFSENIDWAFKEPFKAHSKVIYNKGPTPLSTACDVATQSREQALDNVGRESHTFLTHIIDNYDSLAEVIVFLPGSCMDEWKSSKTLKVLELAMRTSSSVFIGQRFRDVRSQLWNFQCGKWGGTNEKNRAFMTTHESRRKVVPSAVRPFGAWFEHYFGQTRISIVSWTTIFAVSRAHILQRPCSFYKDLRECVSSDLNPEAGHFFERAWAAVFAPIPSDCLLYTDGSSRNALSGNSSSSGANGGGVSNGGSSSSGSSKMSAAVVKAGKSSKSFSDLLSKMKSIRKKAPQPQPQPQPLVVSQAAAASTTKAKVATGEGGGEEERRRDADEGKQGKQGKEREEREEGKEPEGQDTASPTRGKRSAEDDDDPDNPDCHPKTRVRTEN
jgi:hypothetical protein